MESNFSHIKWKLGIVLGFMIATRFSFYILNHRDIYFIAGPINQYVINTFLNFTIILLLIIFLIIIVPWEGLRAAIIIIGIMSLIYTSYYSFWSNDESKYFYFSSPNKKTTLVIEENSWLLGGWSNLYIKNVPFFMKKWDRNITTDDGYRPFTNNDYELKWRDDYTVEITYGIGTSEGEVDYETVNMK